jgi:hypothetical protein
MENLLIYGSILEMTDDMSNEEAGILFKALNSWRKDEEVIIEDRYLKGIWKGILPSLEQIKSNYNNKVNANRENGKKGGRPKTQTNPQKPMGYLETHDNPNNLKDKDKDKDKDKEIDIDKEIDKDKEKNKKKIIPAMQHNIDFGKYNYLL